MMRYLYEFYWNCGRMGSVDGLFVATEEEVHNAIGKKVNLGEALGKHSEVYGVLEEADVVKLDLDSETVEKVTAILGGRATWNGYNPLDYLSEEEDDE